jgi:hypothetical protein
MVRHHRGSLWITCVTSFRGWKHPLAAPRIWTPLFFLDEAVALAAGHRPCGFCRRTEHSAYAAAVASIEGLDRPPLASELNLRLNRERLRPGRGLERAGDRLRWSADIRDLPSGSVIVFDGKATLVGREVLMTFGFDGWSDPFDRPVSGSVSVLTPPTSVAALAGGYRPVLHASAPEESRSMA